jgi:hypothetical protein
MVVLTDVSVQPIDLILKDHAVQEEWTLTTIRTDLDCYSSLIA